MFKKSGDAIQTNLFTSPTSLFSGTTLKFYENKTGWHNLFRNQVTMRIDESIFSPLYCNNNGAPTACVRILIAMMILKEASGLSDSKLFEECRFNMLTRSALGLINADDSVPAESTYYLFRKSILEYAITTGDNLFDFVFEQITKEQCLEFNVSGKRIRMDSKLLGSNIAWLSRYEIIHETVKLFFKDIKKSCLIDAITLEKLDQLLKLDGYKVVYTFTTEEVKSKLLELGDLIYKLLPMFSALSSVHYATLQRVFNDQFTFDKDNLVIARKNEDISAQSVQSPHDTIATYRNKDGDKTKGFVHNVVESCADENDLNLIARVDTRIVSTSDVDFFEDAIEDAQHVFPDKIEDVHTDGAYHSPSNQLFCEDNHINLHLHAIQGAKGRFQFSLSENGEYIILDTKTNKIIDFETFTDKNETLKWRIRFDKEYRYFTQEYIDNCLIRSKIDETPIEILQKRNNVEATIFQLGYHYPNDKSRYRGLIKNQMWANMRALWVNFVRIAKFTVKKRLLTSFCKKYNFKSLFLKLDNTFRSLEVLIFISKSQFSRNLQFSAI